MRANRMLLSVAAGLILAGGAAGVGLWKTAGAGTLVIASKNFTESRILAALMAQAIEAETGLKADTRELGSTSLCFDALSRGAVHLYPEYSGTLLTDILKQPPLTDPAESLKRIGALQSRLPGIRVLEPFGFNDTYVLAVRADTAARLKLNTISDLKQRPELRAGFTSEFNQRADGYPGLARHYGLKFTTAPVDLAPGHMYGAVAGGQVDIISAFSTDANIRKFELVLLEDDARFFPAYEALPLIRAEVAEKYPEVLRVLRAFSGKISNETMLRLNHRVEVDGVPVKEVAREFVSSMLFSKK